MTTYKVFRPQPGSSYDWMTLELAGQIIDELRDLGDVFEARIGDEYVLVYGDDISFEER